LTVRLADEAQALLKRLAGQERRTDALCRGGGESNLAVRMARGRR